MIGSIRAYFRNASLAVLVGGVFLVQPGPAQATLIGTSITATLSSPIDLPADVIDTVTVDAGTEIEAGDWSDIGGIMYTSVDGNGDPVPEFIDFFDTGVILRIAGVDPSGNGMTGFSTGARYVFSGLSSSITGIDSILLSNISPSSFSDVAELPGCTAGICFDSGTLTVFLDAMVIELPADVTDPADDVVPAMGLVTINLTTSTQPPPPPPPGVPEPATLLLLAAGLMSLGVARGRKVR